MDDTLRMEVAIRYAQWRVLREAQQANANEAVHLPFRNWLLEVPGEEQWRLRALVDLLYYEMKDPTLQMRVLFEVQMMNTWALYELCVRGECQCNERLSPDDVPNDLCVSALENCL